MVAGRAEKGGMLSTLLAELLAAPDMTAPAKANTLLASLHYDPQLHTSGYRLHPAMLDATLHLLGAAQTVSSTGILVPASVEAFVSSATPVKGVLYPTAVPMAAHGAVQCDHKMLSQQQGLYMDLNGLTAKLMKVAQAEQDWDIMYEAVWQASHVMSTDLSSAADLELSIAGRARTKTQQAGHAARLSMHHHTSFFPGTRDTFKFMADASGRRNDSLPVVSSVSRGLELMQRILSASQAKSISLRVTDLAGMPLSRPATGSIPAAGLTAMLRVAAAEHPNVQCSSHSVQSSLPWTASVPHATEVCTPCLHVNM